MAPVPPDGLTVPALITAKGAELKFWIIRANETAGEKVLNVTGTVDHLRTNLAQYYGLDLTVIPRAANTTVPTVNESIRDRQWADLEALGVEWKETVSAGRVFKLLGQTPGKQTHLSCSRNLVPCIVPESRVGNPILLTSSVVLISAPPPPSDPVSLSVANQSPTHDNSSSSFTSSMSRTQSHLQVPIPAVVTSQQSLSPVAISSAVEAEAAILQDLSATIAGLQRCEGLRDVIEQIESGAVQAIRDRYGPSEYGRRGTADKSWSKYSNLVSKRERLHRILTQDFGGDKDKFFAFFSTPPPVSKKRKRVETEGSSSEEHFRSFRKIVEAIPWCEADLEAEHRQKQYLGPDGEFSEVLWTQRWHWMNAWEVWREIERERYVKEKASS
ncbi:hypothetical protein FB451DRAFT_1064379 [Mycena latifolia]|nr:hypothetical protein FB451DRAFT_1064379 [Mycena latifolia]